MSALPVISVARSRLLVGFFAVLVTGFVMFAAPVIYFQMADAGGFRGPNLSLVGGIQLVLVTGAVLVGLRFVRMRAADIGITSAHWRSDVLLGVAVAALWAVVQFGWLFPATGGAGREDIAAVLAMTEGSWSGVLWYLPLGILGGGVAEELYMRGYAITVLERALGGTRIAVLTAAGFSVIFFALAHFPTGWVEWVDILVPSAAYVALFLWTRRLLAPMVAHAAWNTIVAIGLQLAYG